MHSPNLLGKSVRAGALWDSEAGALLRANAVASSATWYNLRQIMQGGSFTVTGFVTDFVTNFGTVNRFV